MQTRQLRSCNADADAATIREKAAEYKNLQSCPLSAAKRGYVDTIIEAADTRKYVIGAFEMLFTKKRGSSGKETRYGLERVRQSEEKNKRNYFVCLSQCSALPLAEVRKKIFSMINQRSHRQQIF